ncbi:MAG TPA: hypothetical protein VN228_04865 [Pyrinomonadaceae bacterium]|nr:hypothetical protein [Pyrinomonadaceae bacterium]
MAEKKDMAGEDKEPQVRGKSGPASSTPNEEGRARSGGAPDEGTPKVGKGDAGKSESRGGGVH